MSSTLNSQIEGQLRLARAALEGALRSSAEVRAESLLEQYPAVAGDTEAALELVYTEFAVREELGQNPDPADWLRRFPQWRADLEQMFEVHSELKKQDDVRRSRAQADSPRPAPTPRPVSSGMIGEFELLGEVGRGGMGVVYKARQPSLGRTVAVKVILSGTHAGGRERERFRREAETAARLDHPNIVRIFAVGEHDGRPYCAMEFVDGASLADLLDGSPWDARNAAELVATVAAAAQHAHENGVIHRDLKPANVLVAGTRKPGLAHPTHPEVAPTPGSTTGVGTGVKIVDFGLAKCLLDTDGTGPTRTGDIIGTPAYMSPEQASPLGTIDPAADVWGMGVILYELLVGRPPFQGATTVETLEQVRSAEPVPPRRVRPSLPRDLEVICLKCLRKDASHRYPTAAALFDDLNSFLRGDPIRARPAGSGEHLARWCRRNPVLAGLSVAAVLLAVAAVVFGVAALVNSETARANADQLADQQGTAAAEQAKLRLIDRRRVVQMQVNEGVRLLNDGDAAGGAVLLAEALEKDPDPDREELHRIRLGTALRAMPELRQVLSVPVRFDPNTSNAVVQSDVATSLGGERAPFISDDFSTLVTRPPAPPSVAWNLLNGTSHPLTLADAAGVELAAVSSNGAAVIGLRGPVTLAWETATGKPLRLPLPPGFGTLPDPFAPDGSRRLGEVGKPTDRQLYTADGTPVGKSLTLETPITVSAVGAGGKRVALGGMNGKVRVWDAATGEAVSPVIDAKRFVNAVSLSPDGQTVYTSVVGLHQAWDVKTGQQVGYQVQHVSTGLAAVPVPGQAWVATGGGDFGLRVHDARLTRAISSPVAETTSLMSFAFRPAGDAVVVDRHSHARVWEPVSGRALTPVLFAGEPHKAGFSADGSRLITLTASGAVRVWQVPAVDQPSVARHQGQAHSAEWLPGGDEVLCGDVGGAMVVRVADGRTVRTFDHPKSRGLAVSRGEAAKLATYDTAGEVRVWELATGRRVVPAAKPPFALSLAFCPDGRLAIGGSDGLVTFWDAAAGTPTGLEVRHGAGVQAVALTPDGNRLLTKSNTTARLWELPGGRLICEWPILIRVPAPQFTPEGKHVAVSTRTGTRLVSVADGITPSRSFEFGSLGQLRFSPDGRYLAHTSHDLTTVQVWDVNDPSADVRAIRLPRTHNLRSGMRVEFSADGRFVVTARETNAIVWHTATGAQVTPPLSLPYPTSLAFDAAARRLLVAGTDRTVRVIDLTPDLRPVSELADRARLLANRTLDPSGQLMPLATAERAELWERYKPSDRGR